MIYVWDTSSFIVLSHYFPERFPSFWEQLNGCVKEGRILSVREVRKELDSDAAKPHLTEWIQQNRHIFLSPSEQELEFVAEIFKVPRFQDLIRRRQRLRGTPVADPFVIALAKIREACVVTEETKKPHGARIPNACEHFDIDCTTLEGLMERERWRY